jgi:hypothetical protein
VPSPSLATLRAAPAAVRRRLAAAVPTLPPLAHLPRAASAATHALVGSASALHVLLSRSFVLSALCAHKSHNHYATATLNISTVRASLPSTNGSIKRVASLPFHGGGGGDVGGGDGALLAQCSARIRDGDDK